MTDSRLQAAFMRIANEGHAVGRHGPRVTEGQLDLRAMHRIDPMTGTLTDFYRAPAPHMAGRTASKFTSKKAMVQSDAFLRSSPEFQSKMVEAIASGNTRFEVELGLEQMFGHNFRNAVFGKTRIGSINNPLGTTVTDFTNGTVVDRYRIEANGNLNLTTMFPQPH